jgi:hypothetical protein
MHRKSLAWILTATALALAAVAGGYLYLRGVYVTDASLTEARIREVAMDRGFDLGAARKSGYSDAEVAQYLAKRDEAEFADRWQLLLVTAGAVYVVCVIGILASFASRADASPGTAREV